MLSKCKISKMWRSILSSIATTFEALAERTASRIKFLKNSGDGLIWSSDKGDSFFKFTVFKLVWTSRTSLCFIVSSEQLSDILLIASTFSKVPSIAKGKLSI
eukprot:NODE_1010_length_2706_cov_1.208669.p3 type:complete len:102 gc:universal NODE_1010_length_2706_cov_1.208669:2389-2694(+)